MLPEEQEANHRYLYELASAKFGYHEELLKKVQALHFKCGQGAKTGTGGHLPGSKVIGKIAEVRGLAPGTPSVSPPTFTDMSTPDDFRRFADRVREITGGIPIGFKISANRIERTIDYALKASADYIILDGRGGGTGAAPLIFRDNISVPTIPALARARHHLDRRGASGDVTLIITADRPVPGELLAEIDQMIDDGNKRILSFSAAGNRLVEDSQLPVSARAIRSDIPDPLNMASRPKLLSTFACELDEFLCEARHRYELTNTKIDKRLRNSVPLSPPVVLVDQRPRVHPPSLVLQPASVEHCKQRLVERGDRDRILVSRTQVRRPHFERRIAPRRPYIPPKLAGVLDDPGTYEDPYEALVLGPIAELVGQTCTWQTAEDCGSVALETRVIPVPEWRGS